MLLYKITPAHSAVLCALHKTSFDSFWKEQEFIDLLALPTTCGWVCEAGFILCSHILDEMEILTICVHPQKRGQGIASALLKTAVEFACENKINRILLEVAQNNIPAQKLYARHHFVQTGKRPDYYKTPQGKIDALCLTKKID